MAVDISEYLEAIAGDYDGEEASAAIHDAALLLGTEMYKTADIEDLLNDILNKDRGVDIKMAIHEVLKRLSEAGYDPEPSSGGTVFTNHPIAIAKTYGHFQAPIVTPYGLAYETVQYNHGVGYYKTGNNGASATSVTLASPGKTKVNATSLAIMMYRSEKTFSADGYSLVADSNAMCPGESYQQMASVYKKTFAANDVLDALTVTQTESKLLDILNVVLAGSNITLMLVDNALVAELPYTPPAKTGKRRLYVMSAVYAVSNQNNPSYALSAAGLIMQSDGFNRLKVWYDYDPTINVTPTLDRDMTVSSDSYVTNSAVLLTFDIDGTF